MARLYFTAQSFSEYGALQDSILHSYLPTIPIKNEWLSRVHIWIFGEIKVEKRFRQRTAMTDMSTFCPIFSVFGRKNRRLRHLAEIWQRFGVSKYLVIWTFEQINELWQAPIGTIFFTTYP